MRLPWARPVENREGSYTDSLVNLLVQQAGGGAGSVAETAAVELAAGLWGRAFASAQITPERLGAVVTPAYLAEAARALILRGEHLSAIMGPPLQLLPAGAHDVSGSYEPETWRYQLTLDGPSAPKTLNLPAAGVVHLQWSTDAARPWRGVSPLERAGVSAGLLGWLETRLAQEASARTGYLLPVPTDGADASVTQLKADLAGMKGNTALVQTTQSGWGQGAQQKVTNEYTVKRLGADPPEALGALRQDVGADILAACGVPPSLGMPNIDGTAQRESWRRFLHSSVVPMGLLVAAELSAGLGAEVGLSFDRLMASDLSGRARAFGSLVKGGMGIDEALEVAGFDS